MNKLRFIKPGLFTSIQDPGRKGLAYYGIPSSGSMDQSSASLANLLVGNALEYPVIECNIIGPEMIFDHSVTVAITGADMNWTIDGKAIELNKNYTIKARSILKAMSATNGMRSYIGISGRIQCTESYGSASAYRYASFGANKGQPFQKDDEISIRDSNHDNAMELQWKDKDFQQANIPIYKGPEYNQLSIESKLMLTSQSFSILPNSDRMGANLLGPDLRTQPLDIPSSKPLLPGFIQLLPDGQLITILQDGQTTGGYPRIAYLRREELDRFNQMEYNRSFFFKLIEENS